MLVETWLGTRYKTEADQYSSILQVLLFIEFNLVMHCTHGPFISHPFQHESLEWRPGGDREKE